MVSITWTISSRPKWSVGGYCARACIGIFLLRQSEIGGDAVLHQDPEYLPVHAVSKFIFGDGPEVQPTCKPCFSTDAGYRKSGDPAFARNRISTADKLFVPYYCYVT
jgi:hypothetical protein